MKKFITAVLLVLVEASGADVDTVEFNLGGYKIQVPLDRPIHVSRVKSADLADLHLPVPRLAELLTSAAHSAAAAAPLSALPEPRPPRLTQTNRYPSALQQTTYLEPHSPNSLFPSPNPTKHNFQKQQSLIYDPEQHSVSYYEKEHHGSRTPKNSFRPPRPDQRYHTTPQSLSLNNRDSTLPKVVPNNRYPETEHSKNNTFPILHPPDRNYPFPPHRNPRPLAANQHYALPYSPNYTYPTPSAHHPQPQFHNRPKPQLRSSPYVEYSSQRTDPTQQPQSSRTWSIAPRATKQAFPAWQRLPADPELVITTAVSDVTMAYDIASTTKPVSTAAVPYTLEIKSTAEPVITTAVSDVVITSADHVTSTTEPVTTAAMLSTEEFKSTNNPVSDKTMTTAEHVTSSFKEFIQVHNPVLSLDVVTSATNQVAEETEPVTKLSAQNVTETAVKRMSLPKNITSEPILITKIKQMKISEPTAVGSDPVTTPVPAVTTNYQLVLKNTIKGSAVRRGVTAPSLRATRATRAMRATRATPGAATLVSCITASGRKVGPAQRHGGTRPARGRALSKRPPRARTAPTAPTAYQPRTRHVPATYPPRTRHATSTNPPRAITR